MITVNAIRVVFDVLVSLFFRKWNIMYSASVSFFRKWNIMYSASVSIACYC
jgi:hypothetical protein